MDFIDLDFTINVSFGTMTREQYDEFISFFGDRFFDNKIDNKKLIELLSLDKRTISLSRIAHPSVDEVNQNISNASIELIC
ncbi:hypothetical protein [Flavobacterium sp.]